MDFGVSGDGSTLDVGFVNHIDKWCEVKRISGGTG